MFDKYQEHLQDSAHDNSRFDGFCRGDIGREDLGHDEWKETIIGRMRCCAGTVEVVEVRLGKETNFYVRVEGQTVTSLMDRERALEVGRWWVEGAAA